MIFYVFASAVIGGVSLNGGRGRLIGALTGVILLGLLQNILILSQIAAFWIDAAYGAIILVALIFSWATSREDRRGVREFRTRLSQPTRTAAAGGQRSQQQARRDCRGRRGPQRRGNRCALPYLSRRGHQKEDHRV